MCSARLEALEHLTPAALRRKCHMSVLHAFVQRMRSWRDSSCRIQHGLCSLGTAGSTNRLRIAQVNCEDARSAVALSSQRQVQRLLRVQQRLEPEMRVEGFGCVVFGIHDQSVGRDLLPGLQAAIDGAT